MYIWIKVFKQWKGQNFSTVSHAQCQAVIHYLVVMMWLLTDVSPSKNASLWHFGCLHVWWQRSKEIYLHALCRLAPAVFLSVQELETMGRLMAWRVEKRPLVTLSYLHVACWVVDNICMDSLLDLVFTWEVQVFNKHINMVKLLVKKTWWSKLFTHSPSLLCFRIISTCIVSINKKSRGANPPSRTMLNRWRKDRHNSSIPQILWFFKKHFLHWFKWQWSWTYSFLFIH